MMTPVRATFPIDARGLLRAMAYYPRASRSAVANGGWVRRPT